MTNTFDPEIVKGYKKNLEQLVDKINQDLPLTTEEIINGKDTADSLYRYYASEGIDYGDIAGDVLNFHSNFGRFANEHTRTMAQDAGKLPVEVNRIMNELPIVLAYQDASYRSTSNNGIIEDNINNENRIIKDYHVTTLARYDLPPEAWGGI